MREVLRLYVRLVGASLRSLMQYKFSFLVTFSLQFLISIADFLVVLAVLLNFRSLGGWNMYQVGVLYGVTSCSMGLYRTFFNEIHSFQNYIIRGEFDNLLLRPWPTLLVLASRQIQLFRLGSAFQAVVILLASVHFLGGTAALGFGGVLYIFMLPLIGCLICCAISIAVSSTAFWTGRVRDLQVFVYYAPSTAAGYPLDVYPGWLRTVLLIVPVGFIGYVPLRPVLGLGGSTWHMLLPFLAAAVSLWVALKLWSLGERAYHSTGS